MLVELNVPKQTKKDPIEKALSLIKEHTNVEAVGIRIKKDNDFPYYASKGFSENFLKCENFLGNLNINRAKENSKENFSLACICGEVIYKNRDLFKDSFTKKGSFWTNSTSELLNKNKNKNKNLNSKIVYKNRCNKEGYESVALIPITLGVENIGLLQLNDSRKGVFNYAFVDYFEGITNAIGNIIIKQTLESKVESSNERYKELYESSRDAIMMLGPPSWKFYAGNPATIKLFGCKNEKDFVSQGPDNLSPEYQPNGELSEIKAKKMIDKAMREGHYFFEWAHKKKDGTIFPATVLLTKINFGGEDSLQATVRDISNQKEAEKNRQIMGSLDYVGVLAGGLAHDFRNILTSLQGNISLIDMCQGEERKEVMGDINDALKGAKDLTNKLMIFSKGDSLVKKRASLEKIVRENSSFILAGSKSSIDYDFRKNLWEVNVDSGQMGQVIQNLLINANQSMPKGDKIKVTVRNILLKRSYVGLAKGKYVKLSVKDYGKGIPKKDQGRIFEPYFTTKQNGNGLGLATAYRIVEKHGGKLTLNSKVGKGTTFHVYLKSNGKLYGEIDKKIKSNKVKLISSKAKILIMDDEVHIRNMAGRILKREGYLIDFAENGNEAINKYKKAFDSGKPYNALVLDLTIPGGMGGKETIKQIYSLNPKVKAIVSSGYDFDKSGDMDLKDYFKASIQKPYDIKAFRDIIRRVIGED